nr:ankyrin repeat-containing protein BDA1-like [Quercus suber]
MDAKVERLKQIAQSGDIDAFSILIREDVQLLEHIDELPFADTPLHIAASAGHIPFALALMELKLSFARKLNPDGFSPIHLALKNGHIELVRQLLEIDRDLARVKGKECITPLHYVVETGDCHIDLLDKFLLVSPNSIADVTVRDETALHIALKNEQLEAFKFLLGWLGRNLFKNTSLNVFSVLNRKDDEGNTVVCHLLTWGSRFVEVNRMNSEGKKAWDISQGQTQVNNREIKLMLHSAGASSGLSLSTVTQSDDNNIDEFYNLIGEDVKLLEYIDELPFVNTPLHIAASYGNIQFALEMMSLKPSFVRKLYPNGFSPIHLALQNGHIELVRRLLQLDGDLVLVKGREWLTPLHYIVESGEHLNLLEEFLLLCPDSITDVTVRNETALHIALKYIRREAFQFLVGWLANNSSKKC